MMHKVVKESCHMVAMLENLILEENLPIHMHVSRDHDETGEPFSVALLEYDEKDSRIVDTVIQDARTLTTGIAL